VVLVEGEEVTDNRGVVSQRAGFRVEPQREHKLDDYSGRAAAF
jgi:hypothetical protein